MNSIVSDKDEMREERAEPMQLTAEAIMRLVDIIFLGREDEGTELPS